MRTQLGSFRQQLVNADWDAQVETGQGNLSSTGSLNLAVQLFNRVGANYLSVVRTVNYIPGDRIAITFNESAVKFAEEVFKLIISGQVTGNPQDSVQLAEINFRLSDQVSTEILPLTIYLSEDSHIETTNIEIATPGDFPTTPINGQLREVVSESNAIYMYDALTVQWIPYYRNTTFTYLANTRDPYGADQALGAPEIITLPPIDTESTPVTTVDKRYWLVNTNSEESGLTEGGKYTLRISIGNAVLNSQNIPYGNILAGAFKFTFIGYYRLQTGETDTGIEFVNVPQVWHPIYNLIEFITLVPAGFAAIIDVRLEVDIFALTQAGVKMSDVLTLGFQAVGDVGMPSELAALTGNAIYGDGDRCVVLPDLIRSGAGVAGGFFFRIRREVLGIFALAQANTENQYVIIDGATDGNVRVSTSTARRTSEELRAKFSTYPGGAEVGEFSDEFELTTSAGLQITVQHPVNNGNRATIRANYPDTLIAGNPNAIWDNPDYRVYIIFNGATLYRANNLSTSGSSATDTFTLLNLSEYTVIPALPSVVQSLGADFGLYTPGKPTLQSAGGGALAAGTYQVAIRYEYTSPNLRITRLKHDDTDLLPTFNSTFADFLTSEQTWQPGVYTIAEAREIAPAMRRLGSVFLISEDATQYAPQPYTYLPNLSSPDDGDLIIRFTAGTGGLTPMNRTIFVDNEDGVMPPRNLVRLIPPLRAYPDPLGASVNLRVDLSSIPPNDIKRIVVNSKFKYVTNSKRKIFTS